MTNNSPNLPIEPDEVDAIDEQLSALADGELHGDEMVDLEQYAVDADTTLENLLHPIESVRSSLSATLDEPAPAANRMAHLSAALDQMDSPEVASLAAARVDRRSSEQAQLEKSQRLNQRLRRLSAVAAAVAVLGGIGLLALQPRGGDDTAAVGSAESDDAASDDGAASFDTEAARENEASATTTTRSFDDDDAMSDEDDGAMSDDAMEGDAMSDDAMEEADPAAVDLAESPTLFSVPDDIELQGLNLDELAAVGDSTVEQLRTDAEANELQCPVEAFAADQNSIGIDRAILVEQAGELFELVVLADEQLLVFTLPDCVLFD